MRQIKIHSDVFFWGILLIFFLLCYCGCADKIGYEFNKGSLRAAYEIYSTR